MSASRAASAHPCLPTAMSEKSHEIPPLDYSPSPDWDALRLQTLAPGGFGGARAYIWPRLLHVHLDLNLNRSPQNSHNEHEPHQDERQIQLDTDRSFVLYPVDDSPEDSRLARQAELNKLIVNVFRRRPGLNYFQGFHDIATVLQLTLPPEVALQTLEKLSLHRLRDSMGHTLEPLTGLMIILQRLLRIADPAYATLLEEHSPLPYAALPHLLTLFAHAAPTLPLIQHIFDYILVRPPLIIVYLVAAVILLRKDQVLRISGGSDEGMIHSILTGLPTFTDYDNVHGDDHALPDPEPVPATQNAPAFSDPANIPLPPSAASTPPASPTHAKSFHSQTAYSLLSVLLLSDELFVRFPPSTPDLCLTHTLGPASAMRTWSQESASLPSDDQAEALVVAGIDIVVHDALEPPSPRKEPGQSAKKGSTRKLRRSETQLLVGAVLVLGVAVAVGVRARRGKADWRPLFDILGGVGERLLGMFGDAQPWL